MPVCPKCGFNGQNEDTCEKCGVIYARMHTVFEPRPNLEEMMKGSGPASRSRFDPPSRPSSKPKNGPPSISHVAIPMPSRPPTPLRPAPALPDAKTEMAVSPFVQGPPSRSEVTMVPILPPPPERQSRVPVLVGLLVLCLASWGFLKIRESQQDRNAGGEVHAVEDADYYDLAVGSVLSDTQMQFRKVTDVEAAKKTRDELLAREAKLRTALVEAPLTPAHRAVLNSVLDDVAQFLATEAESAISRVAEPPPPSDEVAIVVARPGEEPPAPPEPGKTDQSLLKRASKALANAPH